MEKVKALLGIFISSLFIAVIPALARDIAYDGTELQIYVSSGEPTQISFPAEIAGGFKKKQSAIMLDRSGKDLVIFPKPNLSSQGEVVLVRLRDGRAYSIRALPATAEHPRDTIVNVEDDRSGVLLADEEEEPRYKEKRYPYAPPTKVSGLMREMVLLGEFGKTNIPGYQISEKYKGQLVFDDGTLMAVIDKIVIGPNLWGYILKARNELSQSQKIDPSVFRLDGTRAVSASRWELAPKPLTAEQQLADAHTAKIYIITRAKPIN